MNQLEHQYLGNVAGQLRNFKRKSQRLYSFSCPFCGDSSTDKKKARGNVFTDGKGATRFHCYNCDVSKSFDNFIKELNPMVYREYLLEKMKDLNKNNPNQKFYDSAKKPVYVKDTPLKLLKKVSQLPFNHYCKEYVVKRKIPTEYHHKLFLAPQFFHWINEHVELGKFSKDALKNDEPRLIIPMLDKNGNMHGLQGRSFDPKSPNKYISIITDETIPKVYGIDTVNYNEYIPVLEGPIDSMFVYNAIAACGGELTSTLETFNREKLIICYDNEPRHKYTLQKISKAILNGYRVCLWSDEFTQKDVNEMVLAGYKPDYIYSSIIKNSYSGIEAQLRFKEWRKYE